MAERSTRKNYSPRERKSMLLMGDIIIALGALLIALVIWWNDDSWLGSSLKFFSERIDLWFYLLPLLWIIVLYPLYNIKNASSRRYTVSYLFIACAVCVGIYLIIFFLSTPKSLPRTPVIVFFIFVALLTLIWRLLYMKYTFNTKALPVTLIVGAGKAGTRIAEIINNVRTPSFNVVGFIDDDPEKFGKEIEGYKVLGGSDQFFDLVNTYEADCIIMAISNHLYGEMFDALTIAEEHGLTVLTMPKVYEDLLGRVPIQLLNTDWMLRSFYDVCHTGPAFEIAKRLLDIFGALLGMGVFVLILPFVALATYVDSGKPIFYTQERLGLRGTPFKIIKFRTMKVDAEQDGIARPASENDSRVTKVGNFLRRSHLDEMPQFFNVLCGDLSLVGPRAERPEIVKDLQREIPFYRGRLLARPGITGWAQVNYGYAENAEQNAVKLEYDLYYIKHRSIFMDVSILFKTLRTIFGLKGR